MAQHSNYIAFRGNVVHATHSRRAELLEDRLFIVSSPEAGGNIVEIADGTNEAATLQKYNISVDSVKRLKDGQFLVPGFIDLHIHAPQYSYTGTATHLPVMQWLEQYTFPREARLRDASVARHELQAVVSRLLSYGTTTALYFASLDLQPSQMLASIAHEVGQRAYVGLVAMDRNGVGDYVKSTEDNVTDTQRFVDFVRGLGSPLVQPVLTPRFIPTCTPELLARLGNLAQEQDVMVQSHISESLDEVAATLALHPEVNGRDIRLFDAAGLLTQRSVYAHAVALTDDELQLMASRGAAIAHCPLSNFFFADMPLRVRRCLDLGVKVGLGTDMAGGYSPSMLQSIRATVLNTKALRMQTLAKKALVEQLAGSCPPVHVGDPDAGLLTFEDGFYLATIGGARALGIEDRVGDFVVGKEFDALLVDTTDTAVFDLFDGDTPLDAFQKFVNLGDDRNIKAVYVKARKVK